MKLVTAREMQNLDRLAVEEYSIPGIVLMENASKAVADVAVWMLDKCEVNSIIVVCGKGNNGGDGFGAARWLASYGYDVKVMFVGDDLDVVQGDAAIELNMLLSAGVDVVCVADEEALFVAEVDLQNADLIIDAMLGTGFEGELRGNYKKLCQIINDCETKVLAVDVPTGVNADKGTVADDAIRADATVTMALVKCGMLQYPAREFVGELHIAEIGMPQNMLDNCNSKKYLLTPEIISRLLPIRSRNAHKGDAGRVVVVAGSPGFIGAAALCSKSAVKAGAGLVSLLSPESSAALLAIKLDEEMVHALDEDINCELTPSAIEDILDKVSGADVLAIGPGLGTGKRTMAAVREVLLQIDKPVVIDADALTALKDHTYVLNEMAAPKVLTPHPGEFARLTGLSIEEINSNRVELAAKFAERWNAVVVLKGAATVIGCPNGTVYVNTTGCEAMATGGSGDVLTGIIASLAGQGISLQEAALCGVYLHGVAGELAANDSIGLAAGEITQCLPRALQLAKEDSNTEELVCNHALKVLE